MTDTPAPAPEIPEEMVEKAARALCEQRKLDPDYRDSLWDEESETLVPQPPAWQSYVDDARIALTAAGVPALLARVKELEAELAKRGTP